MDDGWTQFIFQILAIVVVVGGSLALILPKALEKFVIEQIKFKHKARLKEVESSFQIYGDMLRSAIEESGASGHALRHKCIESVESLWREILRVEREFGSLVGIVNITTEQELNNLLRGKGSSQARDVLSQFSDLQSIMENAGMGNTPRITTERIFVSEKLWKTFGALVGIHARLAILVSQGIANEKNVDWKHDKLMMRLAKSVIQDEEWKEIQNLRLSGFKELTERIRQEFLHEAKRTMRGAEQFGEALGDFHNIVTQQEIVAHEERSERTLGN